MHASTHVRAYLSSCGHECMFAFPIMHQAPGCTHRYTHYGCSYIPHRRSSPPQNMVTFVLNLLATPVTLCKGWQSGSKLTPAPYEKAQTSEEMIYMQAVRSSRQLSTEVLHAHECVVSE